MSGWMVATLALVGAAAVPIWVALVSADINQRIAAAQLASVLTLFSLVTMSFAFSQSAYLDLALSALLLSLPGGFVIAVFYERWL